MGFLNEGKGAQAEDYTWQRVEDNMRIKDQKIVMPAILKYELERIHKYQEDLKGHTYIAPRIDLALLAAERLILELEKKY